jgi:hypothetical protein
LICGLHVGAHLGDINRRWAWRRLCHSHASADPKNCRAAKIE